MHLATLPLLAITALAPAATVAADDWPYPEDTPVVEPVSVGLAGKQPADFIRYLLANGAQSASVSPDGTTIAFSWNVSGEPQLWTVPSSGGFPQQLTFGNAITFYEWAPDGQHLLIGRDAEGNEREGYYLLSRDGNKERQVLPLSDAFRSFGMFSPDGSQILYSSTERNGRDYDIYVADVATGASRRVYEGSFGFFPAAWQPGGQLVIVTETRGEDAENVYLLNLADGELQPLFRPEIAAAFNSFNWLPDGSGFYLATNLDREFQALAHYDLKSETLDLLIESDKDVEEVELSGDGRYLAWRINRDGWTDVFVRDLESNEDLAVPAALPEGIHGLDFANTAPVLAVHLSAPAIPGDVYVWNLESGDLTRPVASNTAGLSGSDFVTPVAVRYAARDGVQLQGLLYLPYADRSDGTPPVLVQVHGGPTAQSRPGFRAIEQFVVNNGIAVFAVNVRGSTGFGKTYARLDNQEKRLDSVRDLVDTVAYLSGRDDVDGSRAAVMGGSYGGYMVNAVLGEYPGVFDAGISIVGVSDWVRALEDASPGLKASDRIEYGDIREQRWQRFYAENSPINKAHRIRVPLLVSHGVNDPRDPVAESDRIVEAVRKNDVNVRYFRFPDEGHSIRKTDNRIAFYGAVAEFLNAQLKRQEDRIGD